MIGHPQLVGNRPLFCIILVVYLGRGSFHPVVVLIFVQISLWGGSKAPELRNLGGNVVHLYRSTRQRLQENVSEGTLLTAALVVSEATVDLAFPTTLRNTPQDSPRPLPFVAPLLHRDKRLLIFDSSSLLSHNITLRHSPSATSTTTVPNSS